MQNVFTRLGRLAAAAALTTAVGFAGFAAQAQVPNNAPAAATAGANQKIQDDQMKKAKADKKAKKAKKDATQDPAAKPAQ